MERMTIAEYKALLKADKPHKYHAEKTELDGIRFDSKAESEYYAELKLMEKTGQIIQLELQPVYILQENPKITYKPDFRVTLNDGRQEVIDVKGMLTSTFRLKAKLFRAKYPHLPLILVKKKGKGWETI